MSGIRSSVRNAAVDEPALSRIIDRSPAKPVPGVQDRVVFTRLYLAFSRSAGDIAISKAFVYSPHFAVTLRGRVDFRADDIELKGIVLLPDDGFDRDILPPRFDGLPHPAIAFAYDVVGRSGVPSLRMKPTGVIPLRLLHRLLASPVPAGDGSADPEPAFGPRQ